MPQEVIEIRQEICHGRCEIDPTDPCAVCPNGHWGRYELEGCDDPNRAFTPRIIIKAQRTTARTWPLILQPMKLLAKPGDRGLGDIVERTIGPVGGDAYKAWYEKIFGRPCGCTKRVDRLNQLYPLPPLTLGLRA